ncbi:hypothetical protein DSO57_1030464 [Entomophthora muscae]|uniref:Uncharacterized protein n=1 Tax=Entomophthora muscae TaxID=34485 RepID=A0ACC2RRT8_9FUNG|nr:hypothetical protein DSO57_1030464 [Entomophthora muscae]
MPFSFHSHSGEFCLHARGSLEDMVLRAIELGFHTLGLSEHVPRFREADLYPEESHITTQQLLVNFRVYLKEAQRLREKYATKIDIVVGAETENIYPEYLQDLRAILEETPVDFLVGSVHHVNGIPIDFDQASFDKALASCHTYEGLFNAYFDAQFSMLTSLKPAVVGHFDLIRLFAPADPFHRAFPDAIWQKIRRNVDFVVSYGGLFEINARGWKKGLPSAYPLRDISEYIARSGGRFTLGDDAHAPEEVALNYSRIPAYLESLGIAELWYVKSDTSNVPTAHMAFLGRGFIFEKVADWRKDPFWTPFI